MKNARMKLKMLAALGMTAAVELTTLSAQAEPVKAIDTERHILSSTQNKTDRGSFIHYTPEELDARTRADIDAVLAHPPLPRTEKDANAFVKKLAGFSYREYAAVYPEFSKEYNVDSTVDKSGWKTLKLTYKGKPDKDLPEANLIYVHGGANIVNFTQAHRRICERLARQMNFTVYIPLYPLAPNYYVPTTLDMLMDLYKRVRAEGKPLYMMGESAGGNITLAFSLYLKDRKEPLPDALFGISPHCDFGETHPLLPEYAKKDILVSLEFMRIINKFWKPKDMSYSDPRVSPQFGNWKGMSPVFLYAGTDEAMYPEIMDTAENMRKAGVRVGVLVGRHLFHAAPLHPIPATDQYFKEITEFLYGKR